MGIVQKDKKREGDVIIETLYYESSSLLKTSYNYATKQLVATFTKGNVYSYSEVPSNTYDGIKTAESAGSYFATAIKKNYSGNKLGNVDIALITEELKKFGD